MTAISRLFLGVTLLGSMVACSEAQEAGSRGKFRSTLLETKLLSEVPNEEADQFCRELSDYETKRFNEEKAAICRSGGWWAAQLANTTYPPLPLEEIKASCRKAVEACLQSPAFQPIIDCSGVPVEAEADDVSTPDFSDSCQVTIAEAESCHNEVIEGYLSSLDEAHDCDDITGDLLAKEPLTYEAEATSAEGPACTNMQTKCPDAHTASK